jgi:hypothetical protein
LLCGKEAGNLKNSLRNDEDQPGGNLHWFLTLTIIFNRYAIRSSTVLMTRT